MIEIILGALLGAVFSFLLPQVIDHVRLKKRPAFSGEWLSTWEPKSPGRPQWVTEKMTITVKFGLLHFKNHDNSGGYSYEGTAQLVKGRHLIGKWKSLKPGAYSSGAFLLTIAPQGNYLFGQIVGPNDESIMAAGRFVLGRTVEDIEDGKRMLDREGN